MVAMKVPVPIRDYFPEECRSWSWKLELKFVKRNPATSDIIFRAVMSRFPLEPRLFQGYTAAQDDLWELLECSEQN